eukprot:1159040-Pelagomonas_calceolata.AAC.8
MAQNSLPLLMCFSCLGQGHDPCTSERSECAAWWCKGYYIHILSHGKRQHYADRNSERVRPAHLWLPFHGLDCLERLLARLHRHKTTALALVGLAFTKKVNLLHHTKLGEKGDYILLCELRGRVGVEAAPVVFGPWTSLNVVMALGKADLQRVGTERS